MGILLGIVIVAALVGLIMLFVKPSPEDMRSSPESKMIGRKVKGFLDDPGVMEEYLKRKANRKR